ncbi:MAG: YncE family protein, partial [Proteobacteria bacterium]|nr:YncE family protein [Pseudomonadota bacterium]
MQKAWFFFLSFVILFCPAFSVRCLAANYAYVTNSNGNTVSVIQTADESVVVATIDVGNSPAGAVVSPNGKYVYVTNRSENNIYIIRTSDNTVMSDKINVELSPQGLDISLDGNYLYVANKGSNTVSVINTSTKEVTSVTVGNSPHSVVVSPSGGVYVTNQLGSSVSVISTSDHSAYTVSTIDGLGFQPTGIDITPDGAFLYVANKGRGTVSVIDTFSRKVTNTVNVQVSPHSVAASLSGDHVYVTNQGSNT